MNRIHSRGLWIKTYEINKIRDDKIYIQINGYGRVALGCYN